MRSVMLCGLFVLAGMVALPAIASELSFTQHNGRGSLSWHDGKDALVLRSGDGKGVHVIDAKPEGIFGLRTSDGILAVDGHAVDSVSALLDELRAGKSAYARLRVLRHGASQDVIVAVRDYQRFIPPEPPAPPAPPVAPLPPPPPPPPPVSGG